MEISLKTISAYKVEIVQEDIITLHETAQPRYREILEQIWDIYPMLFQADDYDIFWRYSEYEYFKISDYFSYAAAILLSVDKTFYVLLRDCPSFQDIERPCKTPTDGEILRAACMEEETREFYTVDLKQRVRLIEDVKREMTGDIMSYTHKDIYYLETKTKSQTSEDLVNLFASPAGRELVKYKPKAKTKYKSNSAAVDFFAHKTAISTTEATSRMEKGATEGGKSTSTRPQARRKSLELYNEAATILGLTCSQTNDCKCIECQCHYFDDFEDDMDFSNAECYTDHQSLCSIQ